MKAEGQAVPAVLHPRCGSFRVASQKKEMWDNTPGQGLMHPHVGMTHGFDFAFTKDINCAIFACLERSHAFRFHAVVLYCQNLT